MCKVWIVCADFGSRISALGLKCCCDLMADAVVSPTKRRRGSLAAVTRSVVEVAKIGDIHEAEAGALISVKSFLLFYHGFKTVTVRGQPKPIVSATGSNHLRGYYVFVFKEVKVFVSRENVCGGCCASWGVRLCNVDVLKGTDLKPACVVLEALCAHEAILGDASGVARLEIWGPAAKQYVEKFMAADGEVAQATVSVTGVEVVGRCTKHLLCVQGSGVDIELPAKDAAPVDLAGISKGKMVVEHYVPLTSMVPPITITIVGVIYEMEDIRCTSQQVNQRVVSVMDKAGYALKVLIHGYWSEESYEVGQEWIFAYLDVKQDKGGATTTIWMFDNGYALRIGRSSGNLALTEYVTW